MDEVRDRLPVDPTIHEEQTGIDNGHGGPPSLMNMRGSKGTGRGRSHAISDQVATSQGARGRIRKACQNGGSV